MRFAIEQREQSSILPSSVNSNRLQICLGHADMVRAEATGAPEAAEFPVYPNLRISAVNAIWPSTQKQRERKAREDEHILALRSEVGIAPCLVPKKFF